MNYRKDEWFYKANSMSNVDEVYSIETGKTIALISHQDTEDETEVNGKLIAAAPLMFEALQFLLQSYRADFHTITGARLNQTEAVKAAEAAIAKVKF